MTRQRQVHGSWNPLVPAVFSKESGAASSTAQAHCGSERHCSHVFVRFLFALSVLLNLCCFVDIVVRQLVDYLDCAPCDSIHLL